MDYLIIGIACLVVFLMLRRWILRSSPAKPARRSRSDGYVSTESEYRTDAGNRSDSKGYGGSDGGSGGGSDSGGSDSGGSDGGGD